MARKQENKADVPELEERDVYINRVSKVVKGGRRFALTALVVVGDGNGRVGVGMGKSQEVPIAIRKGIDDAKKNMFTVPLTPEKTLPHEILGIYGAGKVLLKPAAPGTGVIAGGPVRAVLELAGVTDVLTKSLGTDNAMNIVKAVAAGLQEMQDPEEVAKRRGMSVADLYGWKEKNQWLTLKRLSASRRSNLRSARSTIRRERSRRSVSVRSVAASIRSTIRAYAA